MALLLGILFFIIVLLGFTALTGAPYLPSKQGDLKKVFSGLYPLGNTDVVVDLGSGDGIVLRVARGFGAKAYGYEIGPVYYAVSKLLARGDAKQRVYFKSYWNARFPLDTTVVFAFSDGRDIQRVYELIERQAAVLRRPLAFITHGFDVPGHVAVAKQGAYYLYTVSPLRHP